MLPISNNDNTNGQFVFDTAQQAHYTPESQYPTSTNQWASEYQNPCHFPYTAPLNMGSNASVQETCQSKASYRPDLVKCRVCKDKRTGRHYGAFVCEGCKAFFWRTVVNKSTYECEFDGMCVMGINERKKCRSCRYNACIQAGMRRDLVRGQRMKLNISQGNSQISSQTNRWQYNQDVTLPSTYTASTQNMNIPNSYAIQNAGNRDMYLQNCQNFYPHPNYNVNQQPAGGQYELHQRDFIAMNGAQTFNLENNSSPMINIQDQPNRQPAEFYTQPSYEYANDYNLYSQSATNQEIPSVPNSSSYSMLQNGNLPTYGANSNQYL